MGYMNKVKYHLHTILEHKKYVYRMMKDCGYAWQGFWHDMSKFSPTEFFESVEYYQGTQSPINVARDVQGYSAAWLHHRGRNKHHSQYWVDLSFGEITCAEIPWKYLIEFICDGVSAGRVYCHNADIMWTKKNPLEYWKTKDSKSFYHPKTRAKIEFYYTEIAEHGLGYFTQRVKNEGDYYEKQSHN